jgi:hypothetical protein
LARNKGKVTPPTPDDGNGGKSKQSAQEGFKNKDGLDVWRMNKQTPEN